MLGAELQWNWSGWHSDCAAIYTTEKVVFDSRHGAQTGSGANPAPSALRTESARSEGPVNMRRAVTS
jgi:hypothetical protein